jgi:hypothetical protein
MEALAEAIVQYDLNHTFWCVNPNFGDTGGILQDDWQTVDSAKRVKGQSWKDSRDISRGRGYQRNGCH